VQLHDVARKLGSEGRQLWALVLGHCHDDKLRFDLESFCRDDIASGALEEALYPDAVAHG
jgi:hypothetical protein